MNISISPIPCFVKHEFLYDWVKQAKMNWFLACSIIGISSYLDQPITFHILIEWAYIYSDIPIHALQRKKNIKEQSLLSDQDLWYKNCQTTEIDLFYLTVLQNKKITLYFPRQNIWNKWRYLFSCDFYLWNELVHLIKLENWLFCRAPNHKINSANKFFLPDYKKNHQSRSLY